MVDRQAGPTHVLTLLRWPAAALLAAALAFGTAHTGHAGTHLAAHTSTHMAQCHPEKKTCDAGPGVATPELPSGELAALGLVPIAGVILYRRSRRRAKGGATVAGP